MKKVLTVILSILMVLAIMPASLLAQGETITYKYIKEVTGEQPQFVFSDDPNSASAIYIDGEGDLSIDCSNMTTIINNVNVNVVEGGSIDTESLCIFGNNGQLTIGGVTFASSGQTDPIIHDGGGDVVIGDVLSALDSKGEVASVLNINGQLGEDEGEEDSLVVNSVNVTNLTLKPTAHLIVKNSLSVKDGDALKPSQDASITINGNASVPAGMFYSENTTDEWKNFTNTEKFVWLEQNDDGGDIKKWVRFIDDGGNSEDYDNFGPTQNHPYVIEYHCNGNGNVDIDESDIDESLIDRISNGNNTKVRVDNSISNIIFEIHTDEGNVLDAIRVEQDGTDGNQDGFVDLNNDDRYKENKFTLDLTNKDYDDVDNEGYKFVNINFDFRNESPDNPGLNNNEYRIFYNDSLGSVNEINPGDVKAFTENTQITWNLAYPQNVTELYGVEINEQAENGQHYEYRNGDDHNSANIVVDNTNKTVSYTPNNNKPFEANIYWTEEDRYYQFGYNDSDEIQISTNLTGGGSLTFSENEDRGRIQFGDFEKRNFAVTDFPITVTLTPNEENELSRVVIGTKEYFKNGEGEQALSTILNQDGSCTITIEKDELKETREGTDPVEYRYKDFYIEADFTSTWQPPTPAGNEFDNFEASIKSLEWGYAGTKEDIKDKLAKHIFNEYVLSEINRCRIDHHDFFDLFVEEADARFGTRDYYNGFDNDQTKKEEFAAFVEKYINRIKGMISLGDISESNDTNNITLENSAAEIKYYNFTFKFGDEHQFDYVVYNLENKGDFLFTYSDNNVKHYVLQNALNKGLFDTLYLTVPSTASNFDAFGNGIGNEGQSRLADGQSNTYYDAFQFATSHSNVGNMGCTLVVYKDNFLGATINVENHAAAWEFANFPTYCLIDPTIATVFYSNDSITISTPQDAPEGSAIQDVNFSNLTKSMNGSTITNNGDGTYTVKFGSIFYDSLSLVVKYANTSKAFTVNRVGLHITDSGVDGEGKTSVWHGTDHTSEYSGLNTGRLIYASYYYTENPSTRVKLFVTLTYVNGTKETKIVSPINENVIDGYTKDPKFQGHDNPKGGRYADDFVLWNGDEANTPIKAEAIVYVDGANEDTFGGIKLGSETGVSWEKR